ncbi:MAG: T9SS type A sorting domain-containing protein [Chitinophagaceae bacterium]|nr:T9SS type A sorting domain-containing protein [Chitinophagaceae bacterium]
MKTIIRPLIIVLSLISTLVVNSQVPLLSSHPSAQAALFLDFDGHTVVGTSWNYNGPIPCGGSGLNNSQITEIFNRVAEDYRPFNINVTTDSTKFLAAPLNQRMRVILTVSSSWYGSAGGVAFVNSFSWGDDNPCFVFTALLNSNIKFISEAAAHEAGHTFGLYHQASYDATCNKLSDYYAGTGSGEIGWAPIMGVGYYRNLTLWNNGPNSHGCTNYQSDLDIITSAINGFGYRNDDHGSDFATATSTAFSNNQFNTEGVVERNTDSDIFKFILPANGRFQLAAIPYNVGTGNTGSDLDLQVTLYNNSETALNVYNPGALLSLVIDTTLDPGVYYLKVEGKGNQYAPNYASLGSYSLQAIATPGTVLPLHRLELRGALRGNDHQLTWIIEADEQVTEQVLEVSTDGRNFVPLIQSGNNDRSYTYRPVSVNGAQYRLSVTFDNGLQYYSNVVSIRASGSVPRPVVSGTLLNSNTITVNSPGTYQYVILDMNGRTRAKGQLVNGVNLLDAGQLSSGMYLIRFADNTQQWTDKIIRP